MRFSDLVLADELDWRGPVEGLLPAPETVGGNRVGEVKFKLSLTVLSVAPDSYIFDDMAHRSTKKIDPMTHWLGKPMFGIVRSVQAASNG